MKTDKRVFRSTLRFVLIVIAIILAVTAVAFAYTSLNSYKQEVDTETTKTSLTEEENNIVSDLANMSGIPAEKIAQIYYANSDMDKTTSYIFVYGEILDICADFGAQDELTFELIGSYEPNTLLTVLQYAMENSIPFDKVMVMLAAEKEGSELAELLSEAATEKEYSNYRPADEEEIRQWLDEGLQSEDILAADTIASDSDLEIQYVISLKNSDNTWDEISIQLSGKELESNDTESSIKIKKDGVVEEFAGNTIEEAVKAANAQNDNNKLITSEENLRVKGVDVDSYLEQGFNIYEIENASRLSEEAGVSIEEVLAQAKDGKSWPEIIDMYSPEKEDA